MGTIFNFRFKEYNENDDFEDIANHLNHSGWNYDNNSKTASTWINKDFFLSVNDNVILEHLLFIIVNKLFILDEDEYYYELQYVLENEQPDDTEKVDYLF